MLRKTLKFTVKILAFFLGVFREIIHEFREIIHEYKIQVIPVAARSKARVCGHSLAGMAGSNPAWDMDVCLV